MPDLQTGNDCADAAKAWKQLRPEQPELEGIEFLHGGRKTQVYKLHLESAAHAGGIIAKRCRRQSALIERQIYEQVLPQVPVSSLLYHGFAEEPEGHYSWLFLEDAGGEPYASGLKEHRNLAARWLATLHTSAARVPAVATLPDRGPGYYLAELRAARGAMQKALSSHVLMNEGANLLAAMISRLHLLERHWSEATACCDQMSRTLVHGDLVEKNMRVRCNRLGDDLLVMDWETAGWGVPAVDLTQIEGGSKSASPELTTYQSAIMASWPHLDAPLLRRLAQFGRMFRVIATIRRASESLRPAYIEDGILHPEWRFYEDRLAGLIEVLGFK
jgi:hypothetical protein